MELVNQAIAANNIANKIQPEVIFQNNLKESDIIFAKCHTTSSTHKNMEIAISNTLTIEKSI